MRYDFDDRMTLSSGEQEKRDMAFLRQHISGCKSVRKTNPDIDRLGVDYICTLRGDAEIYVDAKTREKGVSKYWKDEPELALEKWSVVPEGGNRGKVGWTLSESSPVHFILFTFDTSDSQYYYLLDFQILRMAFRKHFKEWKKKYGLKYQESNKGKLCWKSASIFVPASVVILAINEFNRGRGCVVCGRSWIQLKSNSHQLHAKQHYNRRKETPWSKKLLYMWKSILSGP